MPWDSTPRIFPTLMARGGSPVLPGRVWPGRTRGTLSPALKFCGAANDLALAGAVVDAAEGEFVGVGMFAAGEDLGDDHAV